MRDEEVSEEMRRCQEGSGGMRRRKRGRRKWKGGMRTDEGGMRRREGKIRMGGKS